MSAAPKNLLGPESKSCPTRILLDQLADKWAVLVLLAVSQTLRRLEWNGLVERRVLRTMPVSVEYELTPLGLTLMPVVEGLRSWSMSNFAAVAKARARFEAKHVGQEPGDTTAFEKGRPSIRR